MKCLLLETSDKKRFFTLVSNHKQLKEYCRAFSAKMFVVKADINKTEVLDLAKLVPALCDKNYKGRRVEFKILEAKKIN
jgi:hypothetical protein